MTRAKVIVVVSCLALTSFAEPQGGVGGKLEVVSIEPCQGGPQGKSEGKTEGSGGRLRVECETLDQLIRNAYVAYADGKPWPENPKSGLGSHIPAALRFQKISGSRGWIGSDRFTINAKADGPASLEMMRGPMMRAVLEDRFKLKIHRETREFPVYELAVIQGAPKLRVWKEGSCVLLTPATAQARRAPGQPIPPAFCGGYHVSANNAGLDVDGVTLTELCRLFTVTLGRDVIDKTGIAGVFDVHLDLTFADILPGGGTRSTDDGGVSAAPNDPAGSMTAALRKIGLKLEPAKMRGEFLVIDHVEKPTEN